jgi:predicted HTH transcriptional regulator
MDEQKLRSLLKQGEGPKLDYKEYININMESGKKELVKDVIAITNSQGGRGHLIIGIKDKTREIIGIDACDLNEERLQQIISNRCDPPINVRVEFIEIESKTVGVITIFRSYKRPHQMRQTGAFYIRRGSTTDVARRDEIASMLQSGGIINNEQIPIYNAGLDALNPKLITNYLEKINLDIRINGDTEDNILLNNLGIVQYDKDSEQFYPTIGGILLFSNNPQIYLSHTGIKLIYFDKEGRKAKYFRGNLINLLDNTLSYIKSILASSNYPIEAIEESIVNAVVHRDYFDYSREILILLDDKKVEISNPGSISQGERINSIIREQNPFRRNSWLYHTLLVLDEKDRFVNSGLGLQKIKDSFKNIGKVRFLNLRKKNLFKIILPGLGSAFTQKKISITD